MDMGNYEDTYYTSLTLDGQITAPDKTIVEFISGTHEIKVDKQQFEQIQSLPFQYEGRKPIVPGKYLFTLIMNNNVSRQSITFTQDFEIPEPDSLKTPYLTPTMLVRSVEDATQEADKRLRPFQFGQKLYVPNLPAKYTQKGMKVYNQVIFPNQFKAQGSVSIRYTIMNGDHVDFQIADPVKLTSEQLSATAIDVLKELPLSNIGAGARKIVVEVLDGDKVLTRSDAAPFTIEPEANLGVWKFAVSIPGYDSPYHNVTLASQYQRLNKPQAALQLLQSVQATHPDVLPIEVEMMRASLKAKDYKKVIDIGTPLEVKDPRNVQLLWFMGWAYYGLGKYDDAVRFFERYRMEDPKKIEALNVLADSYYRLNEPSKSLQRIQESLAIKPNQQDILKLKQNVESAQHQQ
jgi:tetratricopeptide (TPR) repeat protein